MLPLSMPRGLKESMSRKSVFHASFAKLYLYFLQDILKVL
jgi:hypothetical protein